VEVYMVVVIDKTVAEISRELLELGNPVNQRTFPLACGKLGVKFPLKPSKKDYVSKQLSDSGIQYDIRAN
jgi:hypothetical protein